MIVAEYALEKALKKAQRYLNKAEEYAKEDVELCKNYLKAAQSVIIGLEEGCDQLLVQVKNIDLNDLEKVNNLSIRIDEYLYIDRLRPVLRIALEGLKKCHERLQKSADRFLQWPWAKEERNLAVSDFTLLLKDLNMYLNGLDQGTSSGVFANELFRIKEFLSDTRPPYLVQKELAKYVKELQAQRSKTQLFEAISKIEETINELLNAFR